MKSWALVLVIPLLCHCGGGGGFGGTSVRTSPAVINVSGWDPKEIQRGGSHYHEKDVSALRRNGALALIARSAKGPVADNKFPDFLQSADRAGLMPGAYHFVTLDQPAAAQADAFVNRVRAVARSRGISRQPILLVGDFDTRSTPERLVAFIDRVEQRTGIVPVIYLENSDGLRARLRHASPAQKQRIRQAPYWLALYGAKGTERTMASFDTLTPDALTELYGIWDNWSLWQYGGVIWTRGRSDPRHYNTAEWRSPRYFGDLAMPAERNVFRGSTGDLRSFWRQHGFRWWETNPQ